MKALKEKLENHQSKFEVVLKLIHECASDIISSDKALVLVFLIHKNDNTYEKLLEFKAKKTF
jgi:hypothetical protein